MSLDKTERIDLRAEDFHCNFNGNVVNVDDVFKPPKEQMSESLKSEFPDNPIEGDRYPNKGILQT